MSAQQTQPKLLRGITGFFDSATEPHRNMVPEAQFKRALFDAARSTQMSISSFQGSAGIPNFHTGKLVGSRVLWAICNSTHPTVAFLQASPEPSALSFIDNHELAKGFIVQGFHVPPAAFLRKQIEAADLEDLARAERKQIEYWNPRTVGTVIYNWFD